MLVIRFIDDEGGGDYNYATRQHRDARMLFCSIATVSRWAWPLISESAITGGSRS